jgi:hypothetical protein
MKLSMLMRGDTRKDGRRLEESKNATEVEEASIELKCDNRKERRCSLTLAGM